MGARDPRNAGVDALAVKRGALPFLPTLVTAIAVAALSLLCRAPSPPQAPGTAVETAAAAARAGSDGFHPAVEASSVEILPAALAFARHRPLALQAMAGEEARPGTAARPARATAARTSPVPTSPSPSGRACTGGRCGDTKRTETVRNAPPAAARPAPEATTGALPPGPLRPRPAPEDEDDLPAGALPFVPAAAWADGLRRFGRDVAGEAALLGGAVKDLSLSSAALPVSLPAVDLLAGIR